MSPHQAAHVLAVSRVRPAAGAAATLGLQTKENLLPARTTAADASIPAAGTSKAMGEMGRVTNNGGIEHTRASAAPARRPSSSSHSDRRKSKSGGGGGAANANSRFTATGHRNASSGAEPPNEERRPSGTGTGPPSLRTPQNRQLAGDARWRQQGEASENGNAGGGGGRCRFASWTSFGSVTQDKTSKARVSVWNGSSVVAKGSRCCCSCVPLSRGLRSRDEKAPGAPETFQDGGASRSGNDQQSGAEAGAAAAVEGLGESPGPGGPRPRHRRGHSAGPTRIPHTSQPQGWEISGGSGGSGGSGTTVPGSAATSTTSSGASAALAAAAACGASGSGGREEVLSWGRRSGSWGAGGVAAADREFNRILKAGVDVFKHSETQESGQWSDVVPRRIKELLSRKCPLDDDSQGLVTLFLDKEREHICWCPPGAAELVPDERYRISVRSLVEVVPGDSQHPRLLSLRANGRDHPLTFQLDSDDLYDILSTGIVRILERNHIRDTLIVDPRYVTAI
eukprot:g9973.t1